MITFLLLVAAYAAATHAFWFPASAWVAADRTRYAWAGGLLIPGFNIVVLLPYLVGVLPLLLRRQGPSRNNPLRRGGPGGHATTSTWAA